MIVRNGISDEKLKMTEVGDPGMSPLEVPAQVGDNELLVESLWPGFSNDGYSSLSLEKKDHWIHWNMYFQQAGKKNHKITRVNNNDKKCD